MRNIIVFILLINSFASYSQKNEKLLDRKFSSLSPQEIINLEKDGIVSEPDRTMMAMLMMKYLNEGKNIKEITLGQMLDSISQFKAEMNTKIAAENNFGKDSVFIRTPSNEKIFIATAPISLEELVERESYDLPAMYNDPILDEKAVSYIQAAKSMESLNLTKTEKIIYGNILLIMLEKEPDKFKYYKMGDFFEITKRVVNSEEFAPVIKILNEE